MGKKKPVAVKKKGKRVRAKETKAEKPVRKPKVTKAKQPNYLRVDEEFRKNEDLVIDFRKKLETGGLKWSHYALEDDVGVHYYEILNNG